ncbi:hypothetical protein P3U41_05890 [Mammaliicoccus sciuri]|uniref:hypothetical protein n=1 Tax=Mammaliicoccus sciuri TaxID=1296 RepID=UPI002B25C039|nr:hypothetical protein [Mammaliicoccus sciuri]WQL34301.1 hypothetical protein P3U41_05890 [Mammaliicoccus sciuri]WQL61240.1 hypothetical protein P3T96_05890 [Mammaliicoccus sciuri]
MKLIKNDYVIEGTPKEINEFLESNCNETQNNGYKGDYILTEDIILFYRKQEYIEGNFINPHYIAPKGTKLTYLRDYVVGSLGKIQPVFKNMEGAEVVVTISDRKSLEKYKPESVEDLMEKPLKDLIEMAKSVYEKENKIWKLK